MHLGDDWRERRLPFLVRPRVTELDWLGAGLPRQPLGLFSSLGSRPGTILTHAPFPWQVAHPLVQKQLVDYIHNGFLVPVMGPALHKVRARLGLPPPPSQKRGRTPHG